MRFFHRMLLISYKKNRTNTISPQLSPTRSSTFDFLPIPHATYLPHGAYLPSHSGSDLPKKSNDISNLNLFLFYHTCISNTILIIIKYLHIAELLNLHCSFGRKVIFPSQNTHFFVTHLLSKKYIGPIRYIFCQSCPTFLCSLAFSRDFLPVVGHYCKLISSLAQKSLTNQKFASNPGYYYKYFRPYAQTIKKFPHPVTTTRCGKNYLILIIFLF